ncbi:MAG TPA: FkbM family methyltransferase [Azospirillaceae bacterium]|nr:FkbM family methyltransferase [Azospirillaceae bacterium]
MASPVRNSLLNDPLFRSLPVAEEFEARPLGFIDVGARGGVHPTMDPVAGITGVLAFDPDEEAYRDLLADASNSPWARYLVEPVGLADHRGTAPLHLYAVPTNHSLLPPNLPFTARYAMEKFAKVGEVSVPVATLDEVIYSRYADEPQWGEFIKLDTQGSEYEILQGARRTLTERTVALLIEVEFAEIYKDQKLFSDLELHLRELGFSFYGFTSIFQRSRKSLDKRTEVGRERWLHADALFFKDPLPGGPRATVDARGVKVLFVLALLFGYFDFALELAESGWATDGESRSAVRELVRRLAFKDPRETLAELRGLLAEVERQPELANVLCRRFFEPMRTLSDVNDVVLGPSGPSL